MLAPSSPFYHVLENVDDLYDELRCIARRHLADERANHTLGATDLVHEAWRRCAASPGGFTAATKVHVAKIFRRVLIDHARARNTAKRGSGKVAFSPDADAHASRELDLDEVVDLHDSLERLASLNERQAKIVEMKYFGGMTAAEIATTLGVGTRTVEDDWRIARAWLKTQLNREGSGG